MSVQNRFDRIIESLHQATLDQTRWPATSMLIEETCGITGPQLLRVAGRCHDEQGEDQQEQGCAERKLKTSLRPAARCCSPAGTYDGLTNRTDRIEIIDRLLPHIRQFIRVRNAFAGVRALNASLAGVIDNTMVGVICVDRQGKIVQANSVARAVLRHRDSLIDRDGCIRARLPADDARLRELLSRVVSPSAAPETVGTMVIRRSLELPRLTLHITPVVAHDLGLGSSHVASMVLIVDPGAQTGLDPEHVAAVLGLTLAESRVAVALAEGATAREIAAATSRKEATVRELLKRVHVKLGISRRADLVRTVLTIGAVPRPQR